MDNWLCQKGRFLDGVQPQKLEMVRLIYSLLHRHNIGPRS
jgi:hypothetical protein